MINTLTTNNTVTSQIQESKQKDSKQNLKKMAVNYGVILGGGAVGAASGYSVYKFYSYPGVVKSFKEKRKEIHQTVDFLRNKYKDPEIADVAIYNLRIRIINLIKQSRCDLEIASRTYPAIGAAIGLCVGGIGVLSKYFYNKYHNKKTQDKISEN